LSHSSHLRMSSSHSAHGRKFASNKNPPKPQLKKHSHPFNSYAKKPRVTQTYSSAHRSLSQRKLSHLQLFQLLPIPKGLQRERFDSAISAYRNVVSKESSSHQKSFSDKAPPDASFSHLRVFDNVCISKTPIWIIAHALNSISLGIEQFNIEEIGTVGDHAYIIECVLNEHLKKDQPISYVNKHQPKLEFVKSHSKGTIGNGHNKPMTTVIAYLPASNCFYSIFAPMPVAGNGFVPLPAEWLRITRYGSRPNAPYRKAGQPAKGAFIQQITKAYRIFTIDKKKRIFTTGSHVADHRIPFPPDWPADPQLRMTWPSQKNDRRIAYYNMLLSSSKNVTLGKRFVPGILYKKMPDSTKAFVIDARGLSSEEEHVLRVVHNVDDQGHVDCQSTIRVRRLDFKEHSGFHAGLKMLTKNLKRGNIRQSSVRNQHGDGFGQMYPLGTHMHQGKLLVYPKSIPATKEVLSKLMCHYRKVLSQHIPFDLHALDGHAAFHGMRPSELMGGENGVTNSINVSRNLENPPHQDIGDLGNGTSVWLEETPGLATQWWFVCPNIIVRCPTGETKEGLIVRLCNGAMIDWDGLNTRHCTSVCERGLASNNLWGVHLTNNHPSLKEFQNKLQLETLEREVVQEEEKKRMEQHDAEERQQHADNESQRLSHQDHDNFQQCDRYHRPRIDHEKRRSEMREDRWRNNTLQSNRSQERGEDRWSNNSRHDLSPPQDTSRISSPHMRRDDHHHNHHSY
jgi:hypothetical protein